MLNRRYVLLLNSDPARSSIDHRTRTTTPFACLDAHHPWAVINAAGYVRVDEAEIDTARCHRENSHGPSVLAEECASRDIRFVTFSSDLVFDGSKGTPYIETDQVRPLNNYGISKALAEQHVLRLCPKALVVRTSAFLGPWDEYNFVTIALRSFAAGREFRAAADVTVSPTYVPDLLNATLDLLIDGAQGTWHLANAGATSWALLAGMAARTMGYTPDLTRPCLFKELELPAPRPVYTVLGSERTSMMPALEDAMDRYARDCTVPINRSSAFYAREIKA